MALHFPLLVLLQLLEILINLLQQSVFQLFLDKCFRCIFQTLIYIHLLLNHLINQFVHLMINTSFVFSYKEKTPGPKVTGVRSYYFSKSFAFPLSKSSKQCFKSFFISSSSTSGTAWCISLISFKLSSLASTILFTPSFAQNFADSAFVQFACVDKCISRFGATLCARLIMPTSLAMIASAPIS